jgi:hypothetical protein
MSGYSSLYLRKNKRPISEEDCMIKFYEPVDKKQKVLNKWLKPPER